MFTLDEDGFLWPIELPITDVRQRHCGGESRRWGDGEQRRNNDAPLVSTRRRRSGNVDQSTIGLASSWLTQISWTVSLIINEVFYILLVWILLFWTFTVFKKLNLKKFVGFENTVN